MRARGWALLGLLLGVAVLAAAVWAGVAVTGSVGSPSVVEEDSDLGEETVYTVDADAALDPAPDAAAAGVWEMFVRVVTPAFAGGSMSQYRVGDAPDSDTAAYVRRDDDDPRRWVLAANLAFADDQDLLLSTLVHEYGHILSLDVDDADPDADSCDTVELSEGCLSPGSALYRFDRTFWAGYGSDAPAPDDDDPDAAAEFFAAHEADFVSDYAATNVVEDFAETFMTFVLEPEPTESSPVARKILFFWDLPEYVAVRERIRTEFALS